MFGSFILCIILGKRLEVLGLVLIDVMYFF